MSDAHGWTPAQIGDMTLGQILVYWHRAKDAGETGVVEPSQAAAIKRKARYQREWWERQLPSDHPRSAWN